MHASSETTESSRDVVGLGTEENEAEGVTVRMKSSSKIKQVCALSYLETCAECKQNFHKREPMLLPCLHSLCKSCVPLPWRTLATVPPQSQSGATPADRGPSKSLNVIRCPVCKQECMDVDVMDNFFLRDAVELPSSTVEKPAQLCMSCEDNSMVSGFCEECVEFLCVTCIDAHQRVKFTKDHHIRQQEQLSKILRISTPKPVFCDVHKQETLKLFCETCDRPTCRDCQLQKHKDHNYQFLEDAYRSHKQNMEQMILQLQDKRRNVEDVSDLINNGLAQAEENYTAVHNEIKSAMTNLIAEINRKGTMLLNQLESLTKDHRGSLRKQQQDISSLSRHLNHVITFTKWATGHSGGTALLHCKRLILFQIRNLLRTKCSTAFVPQNIVHFQCQSAYWASSVELGSLMVERVPSPQLNSFQSLYPVNHPGQAYPTGLLAGSPQHQHQHQHHPPPSAAAAAPGAPHSTLAQLHMQVERLAQQQPPPPPLAPPPPHWPWCQSVPLPRPPTMRLPQRAPEPQALHHPPPVGPPHGKGFMPPLPHHAPPPPHLHHHHPRQFCPSASTLKGPASPNQGIRGLGLMGPGGPPRHMDAVQSRMLLYSHNAPLPSSDRLSSPFSPHIQRSDLAFSSLPRTTFTQATFNSGSVDPGIQTLGAHPDAETKMLMGTQEFCLPPKRRRHMSPGPVIVIKDEPDEKDISYCAMRPSLPDSTEDQGRQQRTTEEAAARHSAQHSTGVQTTVSQHTTQDRAADTQQRTKQETSQLTQDSTTAQPTDLVQTTKTQTSSPQQAAEKLPPTPPGGAVEQSQEQATEGNSGHTPSPDGCSDHSQEPEDGTQAVPKDPSGSSGDPEPSQAPLGGHEAAEEQRGVVEEEDGGGGGERCRVEQRGAALEEDGGERCGVVGEDGGGGGERCRVEQRGAALEEDGGERCGVVGEDGGGGGERCRVEQRGAALEEDGGGGGGRCRVVGEDGGGGGERCRVVVEGGGGGGERCRVEQRGAALEEEAGGGGERCGVCLAGGELRCCDKCSNMYHHSCHIPPLLKPPCGQWLCTLCRDLCEPEMEYDSEILTPATMKKETSAMMKPVDKRKCERLLLQMNCRGLRTHLPNSPNSVIGLRQCDATENPMQFAEVKNKLQTDTCPYPSPLEFISDVRDVFKNHLNTCETDSDAKAAVMKLGEFFEVQLTNLFPEATSQIRAQASSGPDPSSLRDGH